jgi:hypothetical protein
LKVFNNQQVFDFEGLKGRLLSSSYMPLQGEPGFEGMIADFKELFDKIPVGWEHHHYLRHQVICRQMVKRFGVG